jgi:hypothetical protein
VFFDPRRATGMPERRKRGESLGARDAVLAEPGSKDVTLVLTLALLPVFEGGGSYVNFITESEGRAQDAFARNHDRLVEVKKRYDPRNQFRLNQNIDPHV